MQTRKSFIIIKVDSGYIAQELITKPVLLLSKTGVSNPEVHKKLLVCLLSMKKILLEVKKQAISELSLRIAN